MIHIGPFRIGFDAPAPPPAPVAAEVKVETKVEESVVEVKKINEFSTIVGEFASVDLKAFTEKYPFISTISMIALGFFGLINVLSLFSPTSILTGIFFGALSISLGKSLWNIDGVFWKVWENAKLAFSSLPKAEETAPAAPVVPVEKQQPAPAPAPAPVKV